MESLNNLMNNNMRNKIKTLACMVSGNLFNTFNLEPSKSNDMHKSITQVLHEPLCTIKKQSE